MTHSTNFFLFCFIALYRLPQASTRLTPILGHPEPFSADDEGGAGYRGRPEQAAAAVAVPAAAAVAPAAAAVAVVVTAASAGAAATAAATTSAAAAVAATAAHPQPPSFPGTRVPFFFVYTQTHVLLYVCFFSF